MSEQFFCIDDIQPNTVQINDLGSYDNYEAFFMMVSSPIVLFPGGGGIF